MIKTLKTKNFECWKKIELSFSPGVNIICGPSDQGKSSIIRMIEYLCFNKPSGTSFRSDFLTDKKESTLVEGVFKDKKEVTISRERNLTSKNEYRINNKSFVALRTDVPNEVSQITKMTDVNIQSQHPNDQYFLLTKKPGQVAKELNKVSGLEIMDKAMSDINSQVREANSELKIYQKEIETTKSYLEETSWAEKAIKEKEKLIQEKQTIYKLQEQIDDLELIITKIQKIDTLLQKSKNIPKALKTLQELETQKQEISDIAKKKETIENSLNAIKKIDLKLKAYQSIKKSQIALKAIEKQAEQIKTINNRIEQIQSIIEPLILVEKQIKKEDKEFELLYSEFTHRLKTEPCPVCNRKGKQDGISCNC